MGSDPIYLPCSQGPNGLPVGVQIIGRIGDDARALGVAEWVQRRL
jgi:Asp-tRNA(Asn)/Glu-tRNA(Gln) amidotransferase A subunit family amidase